LINTLKGYETVIKEGERIGVSMIDPTVAVLSTTIGLEFSSYLKNGHR